MTERESASPNEQRRGFRGSPFKEIRVDPITIHRLETVLVKSSFAIPNTVELGSASNQHHVPSPPTREGRGEGDTSGACGHCAKQTG